jgi:hypothetical protein
VERRRCETLARGGRPCWGWTLVRMDPGEEREVMDLGEGETLSLITLPNLILLVLLLVLLLLFLMLLLLLVRRRRWDTVGYVYSDGRTGSHDIDTWKEGGKGRGEERGKGWFICAGW